MKKFDWRLVSLFLFVVLFSVFSIRHFVLGGGEAASVDALCPFGGVETFSTLVSGGGFVPRVMLSSFILMIAVVITILIFRRGFCGYICPFGAVQEFAGYLRKKKLNVPLKFDKYLRYLKYLVLIFIVVGTFLTGTLIFRNYDPFMGLFHFGKGILWGEYEGLLHALPFFIAIIIIGLSVFIDRFWCKYLCPLGGFMSFFTPLGFTKIKRNKKTCIDCKICDKVCPMKVNVSTVDYVKSVECINCNNCVRKCPKKSLEISLAKKVLSPVLFGLLIIVLFFSIIGGAKALGYWESVPSVEVDGGMTGGEIKGWMTLNEVSLASGIEINHLLNNFGISFLYVDVPMKDLKETYPDFEVELVRGFVDGYSQSYSDVDCPWGIHDDLSPGLCGLYKDLDGNNVCDLSE